MKCHFVKPYTFSSSLHRCWRHRILGTLISWLVEEWDGYFYCVGRWGSSSWSNNLPKINLAIKQTGIPPDMRHKTATDCVQENPSTSTMSVVGSPSNTQTREFALLSTLSSSFSPWSQRSIVAMLRYWSRSSRKPRANVARRPSSLANQRYPSIYRPPRYPAMELNRLERSGREGDNLCREIFRYLFAAASSRELKNIAVVIKKTEPPPPPPPSSASPPHRGGEGLLRGRRGGGCCRWG